jgi:hypothetical protein
MGRRSNQPIQIAFRQELLESNTPVRVWLLGTRSGLRQPVAALRADAMTLYSVDPEPQFRVAVAPTILTPNRDGINDSAEVSCTLIQLAGEIQVRIAIIDLSGRPVRQLLDQALGAGVYRFAWDGRDDSGVTVAPGAYVCRVKGESQSRTFTAARVVGVAY